MNWLKILSNAATVFVLLCLVLQSNEASAQALGVELHNSVMPASGGMGGASIAQPQDLPSAINGNPATISQFRGTQFTFSSSWIEPTVNLQHRGGGILPGIGSFEAKSQTPGSAIPNIGISQELSVLGLPLTVGVGVVGTAGLGVDYAAEPNSNNSALTLQVLKVQSGVAARLTDRLSIGGTFGVGTALFDGLFVGNSKATPDFGVRGSVGLGFDANACTKIGFYYQTQMKFKFYDAIVLQPFAGSRSLPVDIEMDMPPNLALGISNSRLADGRLLLAADVIYKFWDESSLFRAVYHNQLAVNLGSQFTTERAKFRLGYTWAEDAMVDVRGDVISGITPPGGANALQYVQGLAPNFNPHRISGGIGVPNVLPGMDLDIFAGGMFKASDSFGRTSASVESYYVGGGMTWRFRRGSGCDIAPDEWSVRN